MPYSLIHGERVLRNAVNFARKDAKESLNLAVEIPVRTELEVFPMDETNGVLQRLKCNEIRGAAVLEVAL